jgi:hypothetical protein
LIIYRMPLKIKGLYRKVVKTLELPGPFAADCTRNGANRLGLLWALPNDFRPSSSGPEDTGLHAQATG